MRTGSCGCAPRVRPHLKGFLSDSKKPDAWGGHQALQALCDVSGFGLYTHDSSENKKGKRYLRTLRANRVERGKRLCKSGMLNNA